MSDETNRKALVERLGQEAEWLELRGESDAETVELLRAAATALREEGEPVASEEEFAALERVVAGLDGGGFYKDRDTIRGLITKLRHPHTEDESDG